MVVELAFCLFCSKRTNVCMYVCVYCSIYLCMSVRVCAILGFASICVCVCLFF